jgi:hypothetical protein
MWKLRNDGWLRFDEMTEAAAERMFSILHGVEWAWQHLLWWLVLLATGLGLFEWRVRSDNKSFMRLSILCTLALGLMVVIALMSASLSLPFMVGMPSLVQMSVPSALQQTSAIDSSVGALDKMVAKKDWPLITSNSQQTAEGLDRLEKVMKSIREVSKNKQPKVDEVLAQIESSKVALLEAQQAARNKNARELEAAMKKFHQSYDPVREWATKLSH